MSKRNHCMITLGPDGAVSGSGLLIFFHLAGLLCFSIPLTVGDYIQTFVYNKYCVRAAVRADQQQLEASLKH